MMNDDADNDGNDVENLQKERLGLQKNDSIIANGPPQIYIKGYSLEQFNNHLIEQLISGPTSKNMSD